MSGISVGHSHPRPLPGEKTLRRCRNIEPSDNVILVDVDTESFNNVVIIDVPESLPKKKTQHSRAHRKGKKWLCRNVIYIDDQENPETDRSFGVNNASSIAGTNFPDSAFEESQSPVRLSKCKRTYSGKGSKRNRYGLNADSESDLSDDDFSDCELVEDPTGKVQELWERASFRRKKDFRNGRYSGIRDRDSTARVVDRDQETEDVFSTGKSNYEEDGPSCFRTKADTCAFNFSVDNSEHNPGSSNRHTKETCVNSAFSKESDKELDRTTPVFEETSEVKTCRNGETSASSEMCINNEREKLKETDEHKKAMEEEWASRKKALLIQAEEAKRLQQLQKRRKAESERLLDMEKRQKERIEEVRDIQRKDEENMNLKEKISVEVRNELKKLEDSCHSMASLLHLLGIRVGGWPNPLPKEVQTAYKRALLTFHPDRASQSDIRQQVEAEEKFKLINRLKEKFSPL